MFVNPARGSMPTPSTTPSFSLLNLASYISKNSYDDIKIIDKVSNRNIDMEKEILVFNPDIVGITGATIHIQEGYQIADFCRKKGIFVVMGGKHVSALPNEALRHCDCVIKGEGEISMLELIRKVEKKERIEGIIEGKPLNNLDEIPVLPYYLVDMEHYINIEEKDNPSHLWGLPKTRIGWVVSSRGCPYNCIFCYNSKRDVPIRFHGIKRVMEEINFLRKKYKVGAFWFFDDEFTLNRKRLVGLCRELKKEGILWSCQIRNDVNERTLGMMKESGLGSVSIGFESGNQRVLDILKNNTSKVENHRKITDTCKRLKIKVGGNFIFGTPTETREEMMQSHKLAKELDLDFLYYGIVTPLPGSNLYEWCKELNLIPENPNYSEWDIGYNFINYGGRSFTCCNTMGHDDFFSFYRKINEDTGNLSVFKEYDLRKAFEKIRQKPLKAISIALKHPVKIFNFLFKEKKELIKA